MSAAMCLGRVRRADELAGLRGARKRGRKRKIPLFPGRCGSGSGCTRPAACP